MLILKILIDREASDLFCYLWDFVLVPTLYIVTVPHSIVMVVAHLTGVSTGPTASYVCHSWSHGYSHESETCGLVCLSAASVTELVVFQINKIFLG